MSWVRVLKSLVLAVLVVNALALSIFIFGTTLFGQLPRVITGSPLMFQDLVKYYTCGRIALAGGAAQAYDAAVQKAQIAQVLAPYGVPVLPVQYEYPIDYPPPVFGLMAPFALLPFDAVLAIWILLSVGVVVAGVRVLARDWRRTAWIVLGLAACNLSWRTLAMGQMTWMVLGLSALYFAALRSRRDVWAGLALALCALKLQYALFFLIPPVVTRRWKVVGVALGLLVALALVTVVTMGTGIFVEFGAAVGRIEHGDPYVRSMICIRGAASWFLSGGALGFVSAAVAIIGLVVCGAVWWKYREQPGEERFAWAMAATYPCALLFSPHTHSYDVLFLTVPVAALVSVTAFTPIKQWRLPRNLWLTAHLAFLPLSWLLARITDTHLAVQVAFYILFLAALLVCSLLAFGGIRGTAESSHDQHH